MSRPHLGGGVLAGEVDAAVLLVVVGFEEVVVEDLVEVGLGGGEAGACYVEFVEGGLELRGRLLGTEDWGEQGQRTGLREVSYVPL